MKIYDLISILETAKHEHGDVDICFESKGWAYDPHRTVEFCNVSSGVINYDKTPNCCVISVNN